MNQTEKIGMNDSFFFDTYAFFEVIRGNQNYKPYTNSRIITTIFNLAELNYNLKKEMDKKTADECTDKYSKFIIEVAIEDIKRAMDFKKLHRKLSIPDAIGYTIAKKYNIKILTGDKDFENVENVEFVK